MPLYNYKCCGKLFSVKMSLSDDGKVEVHCPICNSLAQKTIEGVTIQVYVKGNCYLDKVGAMRDMNRHTLNQNDPYGSMREKGEKDDLLKRLGKNIEEATFLRKNEEIVYKVCKSCNKTLPCTVFNCGTKSRCDDCTPINERREVSKSLYEKDVELFLKSKLKQQEDLKEELNKKFKEEFGLDVSDINNDNTDTV